jgi:uncharacterized protein
VSGTATTGHDDAISDAELVERFAHLPVSRDDADVYRGWLAHELRVHRCRACGHRHQPARPMCPVCWSWDVAAEPVSGRGTVHLLMRLHQGPPAPGVDYAAAPYPVATVELEEQPGLRITSTVVGCPPGDVFIGMPVRLAWIERHGAPFPVFEPAADGEA